MMFILVLLILFCDVWSMDQVTSSTHPLFSGTNESSSVNSSMSSRLVIVDYRNLTLKLKSDSNLTCGQKTWDEGVYVVWKISLKNKNCTIATNEGKMEDLCNDGKSLRNTTSAQSYLHIPNVSTSDVGTYTCEFVFLRGKEVHIITVTVTAPPETHAWLEHKDNKVVAVCRAERGSPAANISWSHPGNELSYQTLPQSDGSFTVESRLELPENFSPANLSCAVTHPTWDHIEMLVPEPQTATFPWLYIFVGVAIVLILTGFLLFVLKKKITLRRGHQPDSQSSKASPSEEVEEVEPYASYVQRVNSIYNSSADLFS